jgi:hypothetical protein
LSAITVGALAFGVDIPVSFPRVEPERLKRFGPPRGKRDGPFFERPVPFGVGCGTE